MSTLCTVCKVCTVCTVYTVCTVSILKCAQCEQCTQCAQCEKVKTVYTVFPVCTVCPVCTAWSAHHQLIISWSSVGYQLFFSSSSAHRHLIISWSSAHCQLIGSSLSAHHHLVKVKCSLSAAGAKAAVRSNFGCRLSLVGKSHSINLIGGLFVCYLEATLRCYLHLWWLYWFGRITFPFWANWALPTFTHI